MKNTLKTLALLSVIFFTFGCSNSNTKEKKQKEAAKQTEEPKQTDLLLGVQAYTFHKFNFKEAIDKVNELGLNYIEAYYGQPLGPELGDGKFSFHMDAATISKIKNYAKSKNVKIYASGVVVLKEKKDWTDLFKFAKDMGIKVITCEPAYEQLKFVDSLANVYDVDVAIHNHPKPSLYWNPDLFLEHVKGLSNHIGACVDIGHLKRMDVDPVEALKKYDGRLKTLHFKDIVKKEEGNAEQRDIIWGQGIIDIPGVIKELKRQKFKGLLSIEYEWNWENSVPDIAESIQYFKKQLDEIYNQ
jgi:sugar phosphate isomerase/epimerase